MDPVAALGLAANVVQFSVYGYKILAKGNEIHRSADGILDENKFLETVISDLEDFLRRIQSTPASKIIGFEQFRDSSLKLINELLQALDSLKVKGSKTRWKSVRKALKSAHGKEKIQKWLDQLNLLRQEFNTHIEVAILEKIDLSAIASSNSFQKLRKEQQSSLQLFVNAVCNGVDLFAHDIRAQITDINKFNEAEHQTTRENDNKNHSETQKIIHEDSKATTMVVIQQTDRILLSNQNEHDYTRKYIASTQESAVAAISLNLENTVDRKQKEQSIAQINLAQSINTQVNDAKDDVIRQLQVDTESLQVDLFRLQLQSESQVSDINSNVIQAVQDINILHGQPLNKTYLEGTYNDGHIYPAGRRRDLQNIGNGFNWNQIETYAIPLGIDTSKIQSTILKNDSVTQHDQSHSLNEPNISCPDHSIQQVCKNGLLDEFILLHAEFEEAECMCNLPLSEQDVITDLSTLRVEARRKHFEVGNPLMLNALIDLAQRMICRREFSNALSICDEIEKAQDCIRRAEDPVIQHQLIRTQHIRAITNIEFGNIEAAASSVPNLFIRSCDLLGGEHPLTLDIFALQADIYYHQENYKDAISICEQAVQKMSDARGLVHPKTLKIHQFWGDLLVVEDHPREAYSHYEHVYASRVQCLGKDHVDTLLSQESLGIASLELNELGPAEYRLQDTYHSLEEVLEPNHPVVLQSLFWLSKVQAAVDRTEEARLSLGCLFHHKNILSRKGYFQYYHCILEGRAQLLEREGKLDLAIEILEEVRKPFTYMGDRRRLSTITTIRSYLATLYHNKGRSYEAIVLLRQCLREQTEYSGHQHLVNACTSWRLGKVYSDLDDTDMAWVEYNACIDILTHCSGRNHKSVINHLESLAEECTVRRMWSQEMETRKRLQILLSESFGTWNESYLLNAKKYGTVLYRCKLFEVAEKQLQSTYTYNVNKHGRYSRPALLVEAELAKLREAQENWPDAEYIWRSILRSLKQKGVVKDARIDDEIDILDLLGCNLVAQHRHNEAITVLERALTLFESNPDCTTQNNYNIVAMNLVKAHRLKGLSDDAPEFTDLRVRIRKFQEFK